MMFYSFVSKIHLYNGVAVVGGNDDDASQGDEGDIWSRHTVT